MMFPIRATNISAGNFFLHPVRATQPLSLGDRIMSRFTKLASVGIVVVASLISVVPAAKAHESFYAPVMNHVNEDYRQFDLFLGSCPHNLEYYGVYTSLDAVQAVAREFQKQGYFVHIQPRF